MMMVAMTIGVVAFALTVVVMNVSRKACEFLFDGIAALHSSQELCTVKNIPSGGNNGCGGILFAQKRYSFCNLFLGCALCMRKNDATRVFDLVIEELTKVFHIHFALFNVRNRCETVEKNVFCIEILHSANNIGKLTYTRGLD